MVDKDLSNLAKKRRIIEAKVSNLEVLSFFKKRWVGGYKKNAPLSLEQELEIESVDNNICPYCLNQINWERLEKLIAKHNKELKLIMKLIKEIISKKSIKVGIKK
nr:MAG: hypothetical protein [uncultured archaeon]